jgi:hypothetical protein
VQLKMPLVHEFLRKWSVRAIHVRFASTPPRVHGASKGHSRQTPPIAQHHRVIPLRQSLCHPCIELTTGDCATWQTRVLSFRKVKKIGPILPSLLFLDEP